MIKNLALDSDFILLRPQVSGVVSRTLNTSAIPEREMPEP